MMNLLPKFSGRANDARQAEAHRKCLRDAARMGGTLLGHIPEGHHREFFCLDPHTWVWHEEWTDESGQVRAVTTRYDVRPQGVLKSQGTSSYQLVKGPELQNLYRAAWAYRDALCAEVMQLEYQAA